MSDEATQSALREMARVIGGLESTVKSLEATWRTQEQSASSGRRELHQKVEALRSEVSAKVDGMRGELTVMGGQLSTAIKEIAEMKPTVDAVENVQVQATGVRNAGRWLYWIAVLLSGGVGWIITNFVDIHFKR
ncbi:DUF1515 domain-containing protein [Bradyrhizobium tropiciagri]|uniref:DUF1515 domain-containing protein n=1 Tax=Bradyrhizobium tropiciagri TaxID=312253 RepID=UPI001BAC514D|nr:DUF1515 domain-containing protein [Bradyrhizobium tropiciagri]MBR0871215.1 DUF1515 domain-containing protein [Bradyrhizobium tropiciagri]